MSEEMPSADQQQATTAFTEPAAADIPAMTSEPTAPLSTPTAEDSVVPADPPSEEQEDGADNAVAAPLADAAVAAAAASPPTQRHGTPPAVAVAAAVAAAESKAAKKAAKGKYAAPMRRVQLVNNGESHAHPTTFVMTHRDTSLEKIYARVTKTLKLWKPCTALHTVAGESIADPYAFVNGEMYVATTGETLKVSVTHDVVRYCFFSPVLFPAILPLAPRLLLHPDASQEAACDHRNGKNACVHLGATANCTCVHTQPTPERLCVRVADEKGFLNIFFSFETIFVQS